MSIKDETATDYNYAPRLTAKEQQILADAQAIIRDYFTRGPQLTRPAASAEFLQTLLATNKHEIFGVLFLDNRNRVIAFDEMFRGTIDGASVYPREVVRAALQHNAAAVIFAHNHPSGVSEPSQADIRITERLKNALQLIDVRVLDHFVIGASVTSFAEQGLI